MVRKYPDGLPRLDPIEDMGIEDAGLAEAAARIEALEAKLAKNPGAQPIGL